MANTNTPFGLALTRSKDAFYSGVLTQCHVPAANANKLYIGDAVVKSGGSNTADFMGHKTGSLPNIAQGAATGKLDGVLVGFVPNGDTYITGALPASTEAIAFIIDNPMAKFNIQANGTVTAAMVGKYANLSLTASGNDYTGISGMALDIATVDDDDTLQLHILGVADYVTNEFGAYSVVEVELTHAVPADAGK